jgi:dipeptidyl aminopeptidase/acylaminoacyl peptidase
MKSFDITRALLALILVFGASPARAQESTTAPPAEIAAANIPPRPITIADLMAEPLIEDVAIAPGGRFIAYVQHEKGIAYLVVRDLEAEANARPTVRRLGEVRVYGLKWVNDERLIYSAGASSIGIDFKRGQIVFTGVPRLFASNRDLKDTLMFFDGEKKIENANVITTSDINLIANNDEHFVVPLRIGRNLDLVRVNVRDGKWVTVAAGSDRTRDWYLDLNGTPVMRFDTNRRYTEAQVMLPQKRSDGRIDWKQSFTLRLDQRTDKAPDFTPIAPGPQPGLYYVIGRPNGADRSGVYLYNMEQQRFGTEVFTHPRVDVESGIVDPRTGVYVGASYWNDLLEITFVDGKMQAHFDGLKEFFENERSVFFIDRSADQKVWILYTQGPRDPGTYHVYNMEKMHNEVLGATKPHLHPDRLGVTRPVTYKARDGSLISGYLTLPPGLPEGAKPPLIVYPHGGPEIRDTMTFGVVEQFLATRGYAVFQPNFRGSSGYGQAFIDAGNRQFGGTMQTDIADGVYQLIDEGRVDASRICIMGESYGGYAAFMGVANYPHLYRCVVSTAGVSDLTRQVRWERSEEGANSDIYKYWVTKIGDPDRDRATMDAASPIFNLAEIKVPILLMHGKQDGTVPFEQSEAMNLALEKVGRDHTFVVFEDAGHNLLGSNLEAYLTQLDTFFKQHLPPATPQAQ